MFLQFYSLQGDVTEVPPPLQKYTESNNGCCLLIPGLVSDLLQDCLCTNYPSSEEGL